MDGELRNKQGRVVEKDELSSPALEHDPSRDREVPVHPGGEQGAP